MSFYGHEIHVGVDCFSVEPLGLRPRGSLFLPLVNLLIRIPSRDSGVPSEITEGLMQTRTADDGSFVMEWYAPAAVTALGNGEYQTTGKPYKTSSYSVTEEN